MACTVDLRREAKAAGISVEIFHPGEWAAL
jgi:hypothetical protein